MAAFKELCSAGIGLGIVRRLAREGARVVVSSRRQQNVDETVAALKAEGLDVGGCVCHVGNLDHIKRLVKARITAEAGLLSAQHARCASLDWPHCRTKVATDAPPHAITCR